jgi:ubiquinone/menaquinone biosynthesis C-methylase UbiE
MMNQITHDRQFYVKKYDLSFSDWPGEKEFYQEVVEEMVKPVNGAVLEIACGTGRVAIRLAKSGAFVAGLDRSPEMLRVARWKGMGFDNLHWVKQDTGSFQLHETYDLILIPGHSFQNLPTSEDQVACQKCGLRHLKPDGTLIINLDHMNL